MSPKLAVIGAGSTYTPELIDGIIARRTEFPVDRISLMDIDPERLAVVGGFVQRMAVSACSGGLGRQDHLSSLSVELHQDLDDALNGADFVITQIRVGGQIWRHLDTVLAVRHGLIGQETTGLAGFAKAMRTIPEMLKICEAIERVAPGAWLINFTNPSGIVTEAACRYGRAKTIGLCNVPINMKIAVAEQLGARVDEIDLDYVGLNHLSWIRKVFWRGRDVTKRVLEGSAAPTALRLLSSLRMIPSPYLRYFYSEREVITEQRAAEKTRAEAVMEIEAELLEAYRDPRLAEKPEALGRRGGAHYSLAAVDVMSSIHSDDARTQVVDVPQSGAVNGFAASAVMELPCSVDSEGAHPRPVGEIEPEIRGLMQQVKAYEELTVRAAVERSRDLALLALATNPLVRDVGVAERALDELITGGRLGLF